MNYTLAKIEGQLRIVLATMFNVAIAEYLCDWDEGGSSGVDILTPYGVIFHRLHTDPDGKRYTVEIDISNIYVDEQGKIVQYCNPVMSFKPVIEKESAN